MSRWVLVKVPPQGNLGRGEACVVRKSMGGALLPLSSIRVGRHDVMVWRDGQVTREKLPLGVGPVKAGRAGAINRKLWADTVEGWSCGQAEFRGVHVCGGAWLQTLSVWGTFTGAVRF